MTTSGAKLSTRLQYVSGWAAPAMRNAAESANIVYPPMNMNEEFHFEKMNTARSPASPIGHKKPTRETTKAKAQPTKTKSALVSKPL